MADTTNAAPKEKQSGWGTQIMILLISSFFTLGVTLYSTISNHIHEDKLEQRKYASLFYEDRAKTFHDITKSLAQIANLISFNEKDTFSKEEKNMIMDKLIILSSSDLVLHGRDDTKIRRLIHQYKSELAFFITGNSDMGPYDLYKLGDSVISECGKVLEKEKENFYQISSLE